MSRPDGRIEKGQRLTSAISARAWNRAQDAADVVLGVTPGAVAGETVPIEKASNIVLVQNTTQQTIPACGVLRVGAAQANLANGSLSDTAGDSDEQKQKNSRVREFFRRPVLAGAAPVAGSDFVVALEPIPPGAYGRCACGGVFACRVHVVNLDHRYAGPRNNDVTRLVSANCGRLRFLSCENGLSAPDDENGKWCVGMM